MYPLRGRPSLPDLIQQLEETNEEECLRAVIALQSIVTFYGKSVLVSTQSLVSRADINAKKKYMLKNIVWEMIYKLGPIPEGFIVVPINYQQMDMRRENMQLLEGEPKNFKARDMPIVPDDLKDLLPFRFFPKVITLVIETRNAKKPLTLSVFFANKEKKKFSCNLQTIREVLDTKILPVLREQNPNWDAENNLYQRLIGEWHDYVM